MIIDMHTHLSPKGAMGEKTWLTYAKVIGSALGIPPEVVMQSPMVKEMVNATPEILIRDMDQAGIDKSVVFTVDWGLASDDFKVSIEDANKFLADAVKQYPERLIGFLAVDPRRGEKAVKLLEKGVKEWGMKGLKLHPTVGYYPNDVSVMKGLLDKAMELEIPIMTHTGFIFGQLQAKFTQPIHLDEVGARYPDLKIIAAHLGNPWIEELLALCQRRPAIYTDVSSTAQTLLTYNPLRFIQDLRVAMNMFPRKVMFGSDWPLLKPAMDNKTLVTKMQQLTVPAFLRESGYQNFTAGDKDLIMFKNAKALLKI
nr:amidohydrolase family protein [Candidatus Njordarchaeota archaeon]